MRQTGMELSQTALMRCWVLGVVILCTALAFGACGSDPREVDGTDSAGGPGQIATTEPIELVPTATPAAQGTERENLAPATAAPEDDESSAQSGGADDGESSAQSDGADDDGRAVQSDGADEEEPSAQSDGADDDGLASPTPSADGNQQPAPIVVVEGADGDTDDDELVAPGPVGDGGWSRLTPRNDLSGEQSSTPEDVVPGAGGNTLLVRFWGGAEPCFGARVEILEADGTVEVHLITGLPPGAEVTTCIALAVAYEIEATLNKPLGDREVRVVNFVPAPGVPDNDAVFSTDQYVGLRLAEAEELAGIEGRVLRVARVDDESFGLTQDYDPSRVNIEVEGGIVVAADGG